MLHAHSHHMISFMSGFISERVKICASYRLLRISRAGRRVECASVSRPMPSYILISWWSKFIALVHSSIKSRKLVSHFAFNQKSVFFINQCLWIFFTLMHVCDLHVMFCRCEENCLSCHGPGTICIQCRDGYNLVSGTCIIKATCNNSKHRRFSTAQKFWETALLGWNVSLAL